MRGVALAALLGISALTVACSRDDRPTAASADPCACEGRGIVDATLLAFLSKARAAHHSADLAERSGDRAGAIRALLPVVSGPRPGGGALPPEVAEVLADTLARLADLESAAGDVASAERRVTEGIALVPEPTYFRGHLFEVRGLVEERRAAQLTATGDTAGAAAAKEKAATAFVEAIAIQDRVISDALGDGGAP